MSVEGWVALVVTLLLALVANHIAKQGVEKNEAGNELARESNALAREGNSRAVRDSELGEKAEARAVVREAREAERHDVRWELDWQAKGVLEVRNVGQDPAHDVRAVVELNKHQVDGAADLVSPDAHLVFRFDGLVDQCARDVARVEAAESYNEGLSGSVVPLAGSMVDVPELPVFVGFARVEWRSPLGQERTQEAQLFFGAEQVLGL